MSNSLDPGETWRLIRIELFAYGTLVVPSVLHVRINAILHDIMGLSVFLLYQCRPKKCLGVGKYTPNAAVAGEMGWQPPIIRRREEEEYFIA